jgi:hypothetical protein
MELRRLTFSPAHAAFTRHAALSVPAPIEGLTDRSMTLKSFCTGLQPTSVPQYSMRKLQ